MSDTTHPTSTTRPLDRLDDWEDFLKERYPAEPPAGKPKEEFRNHRDTVRPGVREFYRLNHLHQTLDFVRAKKQEYLPLRKRRMSVWEAMELLETLVDDSDPDTDLSQIEHLMQTAEAVRADGHPRWFILTGLIHDLGKILCLFGEPQWAVVGDTFPVGCAYSDQVVFPEFFADNPDSQVESYQTPCGIYEEGCGLDKVHLSWGHDEYLYQVVRDHLPEEGLYMIDRQALGARRRETVPGTEVQPARWTGQRLVDHPRAHASGLARAHSLDEHRLTDTLDRHPLLDYRHLWSANSLRRAAARASQRPRDRRRRPMGVTRSRLMLTLGVLLAINTMNFYDRQVPAVVAEPLREALSLTDTWYGWLTPAFLVLYAVAGIPLGLWADTGRRTRILALGLLVWSLLTALSGLAWNFWSLFVMRLGVGLGEASCAPTANSLLGDLVPRQHRARAISVFMIGLPAGLGLSSIISGTIAANWDWRAAFYVACAPGLLLALLCLLIPEPARGGAEEHAIGAARRPGSPVLAVLKIPTMWWIILTGALHNFNMYAFSAFLSPFLQRYHGLCIAGAGWVSGLLYFCGGLGIFLGGWVCDRAGRHRVRGRLEVSTLALLIAVPCFYLALVQPPRAVGAVIAWLVPFCVLVYVYYPGVYASIQDIVEPSMRGTAMAVYFFAMYLFAAFGPVIMGGSSDYFARQAAAADGVVEQSVLHKALGLHQALYLIPALGILLILALFIASRAVLGDYQRLRQWSEGQANKVSGTVGFSRD